MPPPTFAEAQARLAARRAARATEAAASLAAQHSASTLRARLVSAAPTSSSQTLLAAAFSAWDAVAAREGSRPPFRVGQVDAELLDEELLGLLRAQAAGALRLFGGAEGWAGRWGEEGVAGLRAVVFKLTVWDHDASYGAALQNLRYTDARRGDGGGGVLVPPSRWQKGAYGLVTVGGRYAWAKWEGWLRDREDGAEGGVPEERVRRLARWTRAAGNAHAVAALASFLVFLLHGRYRTLLDRVLRMRLAPPTSQVAREVSFEYLNRQLVWHAFTEFLLFVLPLVGINRWRRWLARTWRKTRQIVAAGTGAGGPEDEDYEKRGEFAFLPERTCAICYQDQNTGTTEAEILAAASASGVVGSAQTDITNPYETIPCGCIYCYYCLATRIEREEGEGWTCLRCGELVKECKPWSGDVMEPPSRSPMHKTVGFADDVKGGSHSLEEGAQKEGEVVLVDMDAGLSYSSYSQYDSEEPEDGSGDDDEHS